MRKCFILSLCPLALVCLLALFLGCGGGDDEDDTGTHSPDSPDDSSRFYYPTDYAWSGSSNSQQPPGESQLFGWLATDQDDPAYPVHTSHLGIDIRGSSYSPVYALTDGVIAANKTTEYDTANKALWVRHDLPDGGSFYAVYGHVNSSLQDGTQVEAGQRIASIAEQDNAHLHLGIHPEGVTAPWGRGTIPDNWSIKEDPDKSELPKNGWVAPRSYLESKFDSAAAVE
ncbi:MAG: M23 family metallopeptidase [Armatimonadota bacterium]